MAVVEAAGVRPGDVVLEVGPGTGALTGALAAAGAAVVAVEKDPDMAAIVSERFYGFPGVEVVREDFLRWPATTHMAKALLRHAAGSAAQPGSGGPRRAKSGYLVSAGVRKRFAMYANVAAAAVAAMGEQVVSNLPFNITSDVLRRLLPMGATFSTIVLMLQDEAALRLVEAAPRTPEYRPMSLCIHFFSEPEYLFPVSQKCFYPPPNVDAGVVSFALKEPAMYPPVSSPKAFFGMVDAAFNGKRKMLRNTLQHLCSGPADITDALASIGLPATSRPEELTMEHFVALLAAIEAHMVPAKLDTI
eukprot:SM000146S00951  [mRNA]  locus=s146:174145:176395:+ [translate_table: standard]